MHKHIFKNSNRRNAAISFKKFIKKYTKNNSEAVRMVHISPLNNSFADVECLFAVPLLPPEVICYQEPEEKYLS
jgi:hypothetical protein